MWMIHFVNAASLSWNGNGPSPKDFLDIYYKSYHGNNATNINELFSLMNKGAYYFAGTMERNVWHYGEIGQTHLPDLPRGDAIEYDPFWNTQYKDKVALSEDMLVHMNRALEIVEENRKADIKNIYDLEIIRTSAELIKHTCLTYLDLSKLEYTIREAHRNRFIDFSLSLDNLLSAQQILENTLGRRKKFSMILFKHMNKRVFLKDFLLMTKNFSGNRTGTPFCISQTGYDISDL